MNKMPADRISDWGRIFDRFGCPDGVRRNPPAPDSVKLEFETVIHPKLRNSEGNAELLKPKIR